MKRLTFALAGLLTACPLVARVWVVPSFVGKAAELASYPCHSTREGARFVITDASAVDDCDTTGGASEKADCVCRSGSWVPAGDLLLAELLASECAEGEPIEADGAGGLVCGTDDSTPGGGGNSFVTITPTSGTAVVADSTTDTLTLSAGTGITVTGTAGTDTVVIASTVTDTDTNAGTVCSGTTTYLDGEGNCDDVSAVYSAAAHSHTAAGDVDGDLAATDLDEAAVEAELEAVLDLADQQGAVTDGQVPNDVTIDLATLATTATTANAGDSATAFFAAGTIEDARIDGSAEADELVLAGDVDGAASAGDLDEAAVEAELEAVLDLSDQQGQISDAQIAAGAVDGGNLGEIADGSVTADDLGADSVSASELDAAGVEAELEAVVDLSDLQGALTDAQVPNTITVDTAATANAGDSATAFFSTGTVEAARLPAVTALASACTDAQVLGGTAGGTGVECQSASAGGGAPSNTVQFGTGAAPNTFNTAASDDCTASASNLNTTFRNFGGTAAVKMTGFATATFWCRAKNLGGQSGTISCQIQNITDGTTLVGPQTTTSTTCSTLTATAGSLALTGMKLLACQVKSSAAADDPLFGACTLTLEP